MPLLIKDIFSGEKKRKQFYVKFDKNESFHCLTDY